MSATESARELVQHWTDGDQAAAETIYVRYAGQLCALAETRINERLQARVAPEDIVQSVFRTFFRRANDDEFAIDHSGVLWRLLVQITLNKVCEQVERHGAEKRGVQFESPFDDVEIVDGEAVPDDGAALTDELDFLMSRLTDEECRVLRAALAGKPHSEIASELDCSLWTVRQTLRRIQHLLEERLFEKI